MTEIWRKDGERWSRIGPIGFSEEKELQARIVEAPELLPLSGQRRLVAAFREVWLPGGKADVLAFTDKGRPVVIEVKLSKSREAKRDVIAQTLGYAAHLHGLTVDDLERDILARDLRGRKLADVVEESDANRITFDRDEFYDELTEHLAEGSFRLIIVLDEAPEYLVRLTGYLETITRDEIAIDLVTVSAYEVNGAQILVPQRIDPEREPESEATQFRRSQPWRRRKDSQGSDLFREWVEAEVEDDEQADVLLDVANWADDLAEGEAAQVTSRIRASGQGALIIADMAQGIALTVLDTDEEKNPRLWIAVQDARNRDIRNLAPNSSARVQQTAGIDRTTHARAITDELLDALADAYYEALTTEPETEFTQDSNLFRESLSDSPDERQRLTELADWADSLKADGLCRIQSFRGRSGRVTLLMRLPDEDAGFSVIYNDAKGTRWRRVMTLNRSVIERHAPRTLPRIEAIAGKVGQGTNADPTDELLDALTDAYREAAGHTS